MPFWDRIKNGLSSTWERVKNNPALYISTSVGALASFGLKTLTDAQTDQIVLVFVLFFGSGAATRAKVRPKRTSVSTLDLD